MRGERTGVVELSRPDVGYIEVVTFDVDPAYQQQLADAIISEVQRWVHHRPGFLSASYHLSLDGTQVVNYAQWTSEQAWRDFNADPESHALGRAIHAVPTVVGPSGNGFSLYRSVTAAGAENSS